MALAQRADRPARRDRRPARHDRRRAVLRRRHDHAGDLGALGGRGPEASSRRGLRRPVSCRSRSSILVGLFAVQAHGTGARRRACSGRSCVVWFAGHGGARARSHILDDAAGAAARSIPCYARRRFWSRHGFVGFVALGAVFLAVTGAEALYADMGHFGRRPIRSAWLGLVLPCAGAQLSRPGRLVLGDPGGAARTRSSCCRRPGCCCRWWCSPPSPPSSPARR